MKKMLTMLAMATLLMNSCEKNNDTPKDQYGLDGFVFVEDGINYIGNGNKEFEAPKGDYVLDPSKIYVIRGWIYIGDGSSIKIPAGTVLKGKSADGNVVGSSLIIEPGAKIYAEGTPTNPVVFTSDKPAGQRKPGDWGGVIICGKAKNNQGKMMVEGGPRTEHGGSDDNDNSGIFKYCRVEFAGFPFEVDKEINGITLGSVGKGTEFHHVQVSYANDDSFEWFGGSVNCSYLVAYHGWDDDFDTDNGFSGTMQFLLGIRHPKIADQSLSNGFESDNDADGDERSPLTSAQFCNVTIVGPIGQDANFVNEAGNGKYIDAGNINPNNGSRVGQFHAGIQIRRNSHISLSNSVVIGYPIGLIIENDKAVKNTQTDAESRKSIQNVFFGGYTDNDANTVFNNSTINASTILGSDINKTWKDVYSADASTTVDGIKSFSHRHVLATANNNTIKATIAELGLNNPISSQGSSFLPNTQANYGPKAGSILINSSLTVPSSDFDTRGNGYAGAFKSDSDADNWMKGWTNFDPQNTVY